MEMKTQESRQSPGAEPGFFYGHLVVAAAFFIMVVMWAAYYSFGVFFKPMINEFGWTRATTSGAFSLSSIINGLLAIVMGRLTDTYGPRMVMTICAVLLCLGFLLMAQIRAVWQLYLFFGLIVGTGMGGSFVPLLSTVARWFVAKRSMMTGIVTAGIGIGALAGPPLSNLLIAVYGWRTAFIVLGGVILVTVVLIVRLIRRDPSQVGLSAYVGDKAKRQAAQSPSVAFSLGESIYTAQFRIVFAMYFCLGFCAFTVIVHMAPHATELGISAVGAANILATIGGVSVVGRVVLGRAADNLGNRQAFIIGFILMSTALLGLVPAKSLWLLYSVAGVFGLAFGGCAASQSPLAAELFGLRSHGAILGVLSFGFTVGGGAGPFLTGYIFDVTDSYRLAFLVCLGISMVGLILTVFLKPGRVKRQP
jgi:MFS family permease